MSTPTHRVTKVLSAGDFSYQVGDLVDASNWATLYSLISTDYLVPLTKAEIEEITPTEEPVLEEKAFAPAVKKAPAKKRPVAKTK
jgi:hypothetical protein